jgi:hypothetical protein
VNDASTGRECANPKILIAGFGSITPAETPFGLGDLGDLGDLATSRSVLSALGRAKAEHCRGALSAMG